MPYMSYSDYIFCNLQVILQVVVHRYYERCKVALSGGDPTYSS